MLSFRILDQIFRLGRTIVLARLIAPSDFGLFGIVLLALSTIDTFSRTGIRSALIQRKESIERFLDTVWTVEVFRGVAAALILFFAAPFVAKFFEEPSAEPIIRVIGLAVVFQGFTNSAVVFFERDLKFNKFFKYQISGTIVDVLITITLAIILRNAWALVIGMLAGYLTMAIMSYVLDEYRPKFYFKMEQVRELFVFGKWILGSSVLVFFITQGDAIFVGKFIGVTALGFYQMAYRISSTPLLEMTRVISRVTFPAYSKLQDNMPKLRSAYLSVLQIVGFMAFFISGMIFALAYDFTAIFLGENWIPMVPIMQILALVGLLRSIIWTGNPLFQGIGKPKISTYLQFTNLILIVILIYPLAIRLGIVGVSLSVLASSVVSVVLFSIVTIIIMKGGAVKFAKAIIFPLLSTVTFVLFIFSLRSFIEVGLINFFVLALLGTIIYLALTYLFNRYFKYDLFTVMKRSYQSVLGSN